MAQWNSIQPRSDSSPPRRRRGRRLRRRRGRGSARRGGRADGCRPGARSAAGRPARPDQARRRPSPPRRGRSIRKNQRSTAMSARTSGSVVRTQHGERGVPVPELLQTPGDVGAISYHDAYSRNQRCRRSSAIRRLHRERDPPGGRAGQHRHPRPASELVATFFEEHEVTPPTDGAYGDVPELVRAALAQLVDGEPPEAVHRLLRDYPPEMHLSDHDGFGWHIHFSRDGTEAPLARPTDRGEARPGGGRRPGRDPGPLRRRQLRQLLRRPVPQPHPPVLLQRLREPDDGGRLSGPSGEGLSQGLSSTPWSRPGPLG